MKKLLVVILALCMVMMSAMPAFAASGDVLTAQATPDQVAPVISPKVQEFYDAFTALKNALNGTDKAAFIQAYNDFEKITEDMEDFTDEELEELKVLLDTDEMGIVVELLSVGINAGLVKETLNYYDAFTRSPNASTALFFMDYYELVFVDEETKDEQLQNTIRGFIPDVDDVYTQAQTYIPTQRVLDLYEAHLAMMDSLEWYDLEGLEMATQEFMTAFNNIFESDEKLSADEKQDIADLIGLSYEESVDVMLSDYITACTLVQVGKTYDAFWENPCADTAQMFVDLYDGIYNDESYSDEYLEALISDFFFDFEDTYEEALAILAGDKDTESESGSGSQPQPQQGADSEKTDESVKVNTAPVNTDGTTNAVIVLFAMLILAAGFGIFVKKAK